jgi:hypothetical protein
MVIKTRRITSIIAFILGLVLTIPSHSTAAASSRSLTDRPDDFSGYQIHLVYVALKDSKDSAWDVDGKIASWVQESQKWLDKQIGRKLLFDTYQGDIDVTFLPSKFTRDELCYENCDALEKLKSEFVQQNSSYAGRKTLVFALDEDLDKRACGWANSPGNLALLSLGSSKCNSPNAFRTYGLVWPAVTLLHELFHTYGIEHKCFDNSDLMIGSPECETKRTDKTITLDSKRNQYIGSELSDGIDLLKLPIWQQGTGNNSYSRILEVSKNRYLPQLRDGRVYAVVGQTSESFSWNWDKEIYPTGADISCQLVSEAKLLIGIVKQDACIFVVPKTLRPGKNFTVTQKWNKGPWYGEASVSGTFTRSNFTSDVCLPNVCFVGQSVFAQHSCWEKDIKTLTLQQLIKGRWVDLKVVSTGSGVECNANSKYSHYPSTRLEFKQIGFFVYRWFSPAQSGYSSFSDQPFAVVVNEEESPEPSETVVSMAKRQAIELGKNADLANKQGGNASIDAVAEQQEIAFKAILSQLDLSTKAVQDAEAEAAAALRAKKDAEVKAAAELLARQEAEAKRVLTKKTTITCIKGKLIKKVTSVKPKCPAGFKVKK